MKSLKKIAIVGVEGSGKTVMLASLGGFYTLATDEPVFLTAKDETTSSYIHRQISRIQCHEWPNATESENMQGLDWELMRRKDGMAPEQLCDLTCLDFAGEVYRAAYGRGATQAGIEHAEEVKRLKEYVNSADGVVVLINLEDVIVNNGRISPRVEESMWITISILKDVLGMGGRGRKRKVQAAIALSQADKYSSTIEHERGPIGTLRKYLPEVANLFSHLEVFCTHSVKTEPDDDGNPRPAGEFAPEGLRPLMKWIVDCADGKNMTAASAGLTTDFSLREDDRSGSVKRVELSDKVSLELVYCAPGRFLMGSPENEDGRTCDDETQHEVELTKGFWIGKYPITQEQWECVMRTNPSFRKSPQCPVESVSWNDCKDFLAKFNDRYGNVGFRLPTEAEWEYACRARTQGPFGKETADDAAWYRENSVVQVGSGDDAKGELQTHPVGQKKPNRIGIHDMHGNVWEWCADVYSEYPEDPATDPTGPADGKDRVVRGGAFNNAASFCRAAYRQRRIPEYKQRNLGFRVCYTATTAEEQGGAVS